MTNIDVDAPSSAIDEVGEGPALCDTKHIGHAHPNVEDVVVGSNRGRVSSVLPGGRV